MKKTINKLPLTILKGEKVKLSENTTQPRNKYIFVEEYNYETTPINSYKPISKMINISNEN